MLQLESKNLLIEKAFTDAFNPDYIPVTIDRILTDFDFTTYHLSTPSEKGKILLSIEIRCWNDLIKYGTGELLEKRYSNFPCVQILSGSNCEPGYNFSLYVDIDAAKAQLDENQLREIVDELCLLKRTCFAAPFLQAFSRYETLAKENPVDPNNLYGEDSVSAYTSNEEVIRLDYRGEESIFIKPSNDRVTVIFSTVFNDETDKIFSKVFLQEFSDARKRSIQKAPQVINSHNEVPLEIKHIEKDARDKTYITFVLFPRHLASEEIQWNTITHIQLFRSYFHYHIKIVKCYLHQRMRYRVTSFTKILNRAKKEQDQEELRAERKTASGKRFDIR
ncbi:Arc35 protein [Martiniozyma asiatica (nom. inval.)]|nr:Arc35 protein [Martiniozyma asiatica]